MSLEGGAVAPPTDPLLQLVSLQNASGSWPLGPDLAAAFGKTSQEVENAKPPGVRCHERFTRGSERVRKKGKIRKGSCIATMQFTHKSTQCAFHDQKFIWSSI